MNIWKKYVTALTATMPLCPWPVGVGVQFMAEKYRTTPVYPGVNTCFLGATEERGLWTERCQACGSCLLATTGGNLSDRQMCQTAAEWTLRRLHGRQM